MFLGHMGQNPERDRAQLRKIGVGIALSRSMPEEDEEEEGVFCGGNNVLAP